MNYHDPLAPPPPKEPPPPENPPNEPELLPLLHELPLVVHPLPPVYHQPLLPLLPKPNILRMMLITMNAPKNPKNITARRGSPHIQNPVPLSSSLDDFFVSCLYSPLVAFIIASTPAFIPS